MGIVRSKVFGGANPYGTGKSIIDVGNVAYRYVVFESIEICPLTKVIIGKWVLCS